jgi:hypothetical protein
LIPPSSSPQYSNWYVITLSVEQAQENSHSNFFCCKNHSPCRIRAAVGLQLPCTGRSKEHPSFRLIKSKSKSKSKSKERPSPIVCVLGDFPGVVLPEGILPRQLLVLHLLPLPMPLPMPLPNPLTRRTYETGMIRAPLRQVRC